MITVASHAQALAKFAPSQQALARENWYVTDHYRCLDNAVRWCRMLPWPQHPQISHNGSQILVIYPPEQIVPIDPWAAVTCFDKAAIIEMILAVWNCVIPTHRIPQ